MLPNRWTSLTPLAFILALIVGSSCSEGLYDNCRPWNQQSFFPRTFQVLRAGSSSSSTTSNINSGSILRPVVQYDGNTPPTKAIVLMDGFCRYHGGYMAARTFDYPGVALIRVVSDYLLGYLKINDPDEDWEASRTPNSIEECVAWKGALKNLEILAVYCESDSGLADAERLREMLTVTCRDKPDQLEARRHKYLMNQLVSQAGLCTATQELCKSKQQAVEFASRLFAKGHQRVVVKPFRGVASESVYLCCSLIEVEEAWDHIVSTSIFGSQEKHGSVLVQEFLVGAEYAIDVVSRNGEHKIAAIWKYDKRPANGAPFCYYKTELVDESTDANTPDICNYVEATLNALGVQYGISHTEVIYTATSGPVLVEVNCRQHNMDFAPITMMCIGYNALDMVMDAFLGNDEDWDKYPHFPILHAGGCMVHLVCYEEGKLVQVNHLPDLAELPSVADFEVYKGFSTIGNVIHPTRDIRSDAGWVQLINDDLGQLRSDYEQILEWMRTMFKVENR